MTHKRLTKHLKKNHNGSVPVKAIIILLSLLMIFVFMMEYLRAVFIGSALKDAINNSVISVATTNSPTIFSGLREGNTYISKHNTNLLVTEEQFNKNLANQLGCSYRSSGVIKYKSGRNGFEYEIKDVNIELLNVSSKSKNYTLTYKTTAKLRIPISFFGNDIITDIDVNVKSYYTPKF